MAPMLQFIVWGKTYCLIMNFDLFIIFISVLVRFLLVVAKAIKGKSVVAKC